MILRYLYNQPLAQASYLVGCAATGEALVMDPNRDVAAYIEVAEREGLRITAVTETHIHADYLSGARELAAATGAQLFLSDEGPPEWKYGYASDAGARLLHDGDHFMVGNIRLEVLHTPGHTPEHLSFLLTDTAAADEPMGIFTGDFVFVGDVGRPDLLERAAGIVGTMEAGARDLHRSLQRFRDLPEYLQIWPGHGAGSACGKALGAVPSSTVGYEKRFNWAFQIKDEVEFVEAVLEGQPEAPPYFAQMKQVNKKGPPFVAALEPLPVLAPEQLAEARARWQIVDARPADAFAAGHIPGSINLPAGSALLTWAGWLLSYERPIVLIGDTTTADAVRRELLLIGFDSIAGYWSPDALHDWRRAGGELASIERVDAERARRLVDREEVVVLDVRNPDEFRGGHIPGSQNIPLSSLAKRVPEVADEQTVLVHCESGTRSAIAASLLTAQSGLTVLELHGGFAQWQAAGHPIEREEGVAVAQVAPSGDYY